MAGNDLQKTEAWAKAKQMYNLSLDANSGNLKALSNRAYMNLKVISYLLLPWETYASCSSKADRSLAS
jgi:hypothetical protein